jgi:hypothetical protein
LFSGVLVGVDILHHYYILVEIKRLPQIRAANFIHLGSNFVIFLGSKNYLFGQFYKQRQQIL